MIIWGDYYKISDLVKLIGACAGVVALAWGMIALTILIFGN
jgi:hypothetical protein